MTPRFALAEETQHNPLLMAGSNGPWGDKTAMNRAASMMDV